MFYLKKKKEYYINEVLHESAEENPTNKLTEVTVVGPNDDWDDGLTFTAKSSRKYFIENVFVWISFFFFFNKLIIRVTFF